MPQFSYKARRRSGEVVTGSLEVPDRSAALLQIEKLGLFPVAVDAAKGAAVIAATSGEARSRRNFSDMLPPSLRAVVVRQRKPKLQELATFTQQLANLLNCGMPLVVALGSMMHLESKGISKEVGKQLKNDVMEGKSLSDAMRKQPLIFNDLYVNMVKAGEQSGSLVEVLRRLGSHFERFAEVQSKLSSALIYPAFVCATGVGIMVFFMTYMMPKFLAMFEGMKIPIPATTQLLIGISNVFKNYWWLMAIVIIAGVVVFKRFQSTETGRRAVDGWKMKLPIFGNVVKLSIFGQFARTLSTLLQNGVPVLTALQITEEIIANTVVKDAIAKTRQEVTDGKTIAQPLARSKVFPQLMVDLVKIGEDTGDVPGALSNLADTYESELNIGLRVMTNMIEPVLIVVMALGVGFLLLSVLSMMFSMTSNIGGSMGGGK